MSGVNGEILGKRYRKTFRMSIVFEGLQRVKQNDCAKRAWNKRRAETQFAKPEAQTVGVLECGTDFEVGMGTI